MRRTRPIDERFWSKVDRSGGPDACWPWLAYTKRDGYGWFYFDGATTGAHRVAYRLSIGAIPPGKELDHLCRNRACCNPTHLEPVDQQENWRRGLGPSIFRRASQIKAAATTCHRGHPMANAYRVGGVRRCRPCHLAIQRRSQTTPAFRAKRQARREAARCQPEVV